MGKKTNRISVTKFEKMLNKENVISIPIDGVEDTVIEITKTLPLQDVVEFVEIVAESCVDLSTGDYMPQVLDFVIKKELLTRYANFTMPHNAKKQYELIYGTNVVDLILPYINQAQFQEIRASIDRKIKFMLDCVCSIATSNITQMINKLDSMVEQNNAVFDSINEDDINNMLSNLNAIANMDESKIVESIQKNTNNEE